MPDIETLRSLMARVEAAEGPDRELDGRIWAATAGVTILEWDGAGALWKDEHGGLRHQRDDRIPAYTASIDVTVALIERVLPGAYWAAGFAPMGFEEVVGNVAQVSTKPCAEADMSKAAKPPLALLSALLKALVEKEEGHVESK